MMCAVSLSAQDQINIVKVGGNVLISLLGENDNESYGGFSASLEHSLKSNTTLVLGGNFNKKEESISAGGISVSASLSILTLEPEFRWYPKAATEGFYLGFAPAVYIQKTKVSGAINTSNAETQLGLGLKAGYQFELAKALKLQFGTGGGLVLPSDNVDGWLQFNLNLLLGYQF